MFFKQFKKKTIFNSKFVECDNFHIQSNIPIFLTFNVTTYGNLSKREVMLPQVLNVT